MEGVCNLCFPWLKEGTDVNTEAGRQTKALMTATQKGHGNGLSKLIKIGADVNTVQNNISILMNTSSN